VTGLIEGNPIGPAIVARRADAVAEVERAVAARLVASSAIIPSGRRCAPWCSRRGGRGGRRVC